MAGRHQNPAIFKFPPGDGQEDGPPGTGREPLLIHEPGGDLLRRLQSPNFTVWEQMYRALPEQGWFSPAVNPSAPIQFELGAWAVPQGYHLWVCDYEFSVFRLSGLDAGDVVQAEDGRFSGVMGFDITLNNARTSSLLYQLDPVPVQRTRQQFERPLQAQALKLSADAGLGTSSGANPAAFQRAAFTSFASTAGPGNSLLPVRLRRQGAPSMPFTLIAKESVRVALSCVIFKRVLSPLAFIQGDVSGFMIQTNMSEALINRMRPR